MNLIFTTENSKYSPVSHGATYLYNNYNLIQSFLRTQLNSSELNRLTQPVKNGDVVEWYGDFPEKMQPLGSFSEVHQKQVEQEYLTFLQKIKNITSGLTTNVDPEKQAWGKLIKDTFNIENNMLISDGNNWAVIWGWEFRNELHFTKSSFESDLVSTVGPIPEVENIDKGTQTSQPIQDDSMHLTPDFDNDIKVQGGAESIIEDVPEDQIPEKQNIIAPQKIKLTFWQYIKRFFRWLAYRFWGLMLLIVYTLLIIFLTKQCSKSADCSDFQKVERELKYLEGRIKERCNGKVELENENQ